MKRVTIDIRGKASLWAVESLATTEEIAAMRADGLEVHELVNSGPEWIADLGLTRPWCILQDIWNFKNPFGR